MTSHALHDSHDTKRDPSSPRYKVAIVGAGAVGAYYGARLWEAGHDVQFYSRSSSGGTEPLSSSAPQTEGAATDAIKNDTTVAAAGAESTTIQPQTNANDLWIESIAGDLVLPASQWQLFDDTNDMQPADWILVALKSHSLAILPDLIWPLLLPRQETKQEKKEPMHGPHSKRTLSRILVLMNGLVDQAIVELLQQKEQEEYHNQNDSHPPPHPSTSNSTASSLSCCHTLYGGMAYIGSARLRQGHIHHTHGGRLAIGVAATHNHSHDSTSTQKQNKQDEEERALHDLFQGTKIAVTFESNLRLGRWKKMLANLPMNGITVAMGGHITVQDVFGDPGLRQLAKHILDETIQTANAELEALYGKPSSSSSSWQPLGESDKQHILDIGDKVGHFYPSTTLDLQHRRPMEVRYLFREPLNHARELNISVPYLESLVAMIEGQQRKYQLY